MDIATLNTYLLPPFLFVLYFCATCLFIYKPSRSNAPQHTAPTTPKPVAFTASPKIESVDLDELKLRPARKIASRLGIKQKMNGRDQPLDWLRGQIIQKLQAKPQETAPIIKEVLKAS